MYTKLKITSIIAQKEKRNKETKAFKIYVHGFFTSALLLGVVNHLTPFFFQVTPTHKSWKKKNKDSQCG